MKKTFRFIGIAAFIAVMVFAFAACPSEPSDKAQTMTFRGSDSGGDYTLVITQDAANRAFTVKANDTYKLTYAGGRTSEGKVTEVSGADTFTLKPNDESKPAITAKVSGTNTLTALTPDEGTVIVWDNGSQTTAPGTAIEPPTTQPSTPSGGTITVTNQQLYEYEYDLDSITYTVYNGDGIVFAEYWFFNEETGGGEWIERDEIGAVTSGKLSFTLQKAPPAETLFLLTDEYSGLTISDKSAKAGYVSFIFNDGSEYMLDYDYYNVSNDYEFRVWYLYVDRDVSVKGTYNDAGSIQYYEWNFKKGFNAVYEAGIDDSLNSTTAKPADANLLKWNIW